MYGTPQRVGQHVVSPCCPPHVCHPPYSVVSPGRMGEHVVSPVSSPSRTSSPLQCGVSWEGGTTCGVPVRHPPFRVVPPLDYVSISSQINDRSNRHKLKSQIDQTNATILKSQKEALLSVSFQTLQR